MSLKNLGPRALAALAGAAFLLPVARAQVPAKCLEIESILVDACISGTDCPASTEGMNEMVRFITGPAPIALADLQFQFYSSTFRGIAQNAATSALTAQLNASIQGCGLLVEPPGGVIPAGSRAIFITSTAMCVQANSFTALNDTLYVIFQNAGNSQGHFKNNDLVGQPVTTTPAAPLMRWLRINVNGTGCGDTATYDANRLVNIYGTYGGTSAENDGATANFAWPGAPVASYVNYGCQAAFTPTVPAVIAGGGPIPCGSSANLLGQVTGSYAAVLWQGGGGAFSDPGALATSYTPGGGDSGDVELSFCAITACGDTICSQVTVSTGDTPNVTVSGDTTLCGQFDTSVLTATGADSYLWSTGATGPFITAQITGPMDYWVVGTNACGSDTAFISPRWMHTTTYYTNVSCNGGADGILSAGGTGGVWPYTYLWSNGGTDSAITGLSAGYYSYTITDSDGCTLNAGTTITEPSPLVVTVGADTAICAGGTATLQASATGGTPGYYYTWSPEGPVVSPAETTVYTLETHDLKGCEAPPMQVTVSVFPAQPVTVSGDTTLCGQFDTSVLTASGADSYLWSTGATGPSITAAITGPTSYWVVGTNACGSDTAFISPRWMTVTTYYQNVSCAGAADGELSVTGSHGVLPYTYAWSIGSTDSLITGLAPGNYTCTVTDADGCTMTGIGSIAEPDPLTLAVGNDTTICAGGFAVLSASATGGTPGYTFTWSPEGPLVYPTATTTYSVVITDQHGCTLPAQEMTVNVAGAAVALTASDTAGCAPHCVTFTATSPDANSYAWDFGDGSTASGSVVEHCYATAGEYPVAVHVAPATGCPEYTATAGPVIVEAGPEAQFSWEPEIPSMSDPEVQFHDLSTGATTWHWSFGDPGGSTATGASPAFTFPGPGCYPVVLRVANSQGCADSTMAELCIAGQDSLHVPNVFSPNGDGANDVFRITGGNLVSLDVQIFNRWGQLVARLERVNQVWDGRTAAGEALSTGTYFYTLRARGASGTDYDLHGTLTLLR